MAGTVGTPPGSVGTAGSGLAGSFGAMPDPGTVGRWPGPAGSGVCFFVAPRESEEPFAADEFDEPLEEAGSVWTGVAGADGDGAVSVTDGLVAAPDGAGAAGTSAGEVDIGIGAVVSLVGWKIRTTVWPTLLRKSSLEAAATAPAPRPMAPTTAAPTTKHIRRCRLRRCSSRLAMLEARRMGMLWGVSPWASTPEADAP